MGFWVAPVEMCIRDSLQDLQSRNERMFNLTFLVMHMAETKQKLEMAVSQAASVAQTYNCLLTRLDFQQEDGLMYSLPLGCLLSTS